MHGPPWVGWALVVLCAGAGAYCLSRARTGTTGQRREARGEALMGLGMAVMAAPGSASSLPAWSSWVYAVVFGAAGLWAVARRHAHHAVGAAAMVYMTLAMAHPAAGGAEHAHSSPAAPGGAPALTGLLLAYYAVFAVVAGVRLVPVRDGAAVGCAPEPKRGRGRGGVRMAAYEGGRRARPEVVGACRVAMGIGMFAMLLTL
ncbi:DUF5134 domain-containing protein [Streptomyces sp. NPDC003077]|uniref:DUF5134 domain-containing protein n=1 Tax=Streptomyces sp. NPDC003077 TaxID=3154443 RepID=UPI0033BBF3F2